MKLLFFYPLDKIWVLRDHELRIATLIHTLLWKISQWAILLEVWLWRLPSLFPTIKSSFPDLYPNILSDTRYFRFAFSTSGYLSQFYQLSLWWNKGSGPGISYFPCKIVAFLFDSLSTEDRAAAKSCAALSFSSEYWTWVLGDTEFRGRVLKPLSVWTFQLDVNLPSF
jgi:hypothetical protein